MLALITLALVGAVGSGATELRVRPLLSPEALHQAALPAARRTAAILTPDMARAQSMHLERWRSFNGVLPLESRRKSETSKVGGIMGKVVTVLVECYN